VFSVLLLYSSDAQRTFVTLQFAHVMTLKSLNLAKESGEYSMISMCSVMGGTTLVETSVGLVWTFEHTRCGFSFNTGQVLLLGI
jgi:hypothetical protein